MKKDFKCKFIFLISLLIFSLDGKSQTTLYSILDGLNVKNPLYIKYTKIKNRKVTKDESFICEKLQNNGRDPKLVLFNKNDRFSIFGEFYPDAQKLRLKRGAAISKMYTEVVLFDKLLGRQFIINYHFGAPVFLRKNGKTMELPYSSFQDAIYSITEVDSNFRPQVSLYVNYVERSDTVSFMEKFSYTSEGQHKINKSLGNKEFSFKSMEYSFFLDLMKEEWW